MANKTIPTIQTNEGNVGIGITNPSSLLHISGAAPTIKLQGSSAATSAKVDLIGTYTTWSLENQYVNGANNDMFRIYNSALSADAITINRATNNVGIGTTNPSSKLHIDDATTPWITISRAGVPTWQLRNNFPTNQYGFSFNNTTAGTVPLFIGAGGNIGIGLDSPAAKLDIVGTNTTIALSFGTTVPNNPLFINTYGGAQGIGMDQTTAGIRLAGDYSNGLNPLVDIGYYAGGTVSHANWVSRLKALNNGNVGIGITNPVTKLHVSGAAATIMRLDAETLTSVAQFQAKASTDGVLIAGMYGPNPVAGTIFGANTSGAAFLGTTTLSTVHPTLLAIGTTLTTPIIFGTNNTERMRIAGSGNVGIGTTTPTATLQVGSNSISVVSDNSVIARIGGSSAGGKVFNLTLANTATATTNNESALSFIVAGNYSATAIISAVLSNTTAAQTDLVFTNYNNGLAERMRINSSGNVGIGTTNPSYKVQVSGDAYITNTLKNGQVETRSFKDTFSNAVANRAIDIRFPNTYINGLIEIEVTSGYSNQNSVGVVKKIFSVGANPNNVIWNTTVARVVEAHGAAADNWTIGDFAWDATNSKYIIPIYHIVSTGNVLNITIRYFSEGALDYPNLPNTTVSAVYTATIPAAYQTRHYVYYNDNVGIGTTSVPTRLTSYVGAGAIAGTNDAIRLQVSSYDNAARNTIVWGQDSGGSIVLARYGLEWNSSAGQMNFVWRDMYNGGVASTELMRFTAAGNLGIGTTNPVGKLTVQGNIEVNYNSTTADTSVRRSFLTAHSGINRGANITFGLLDGGSVAAGMTVNNAAAAAGAFNSQFIVFNTHEGGVNEGERMRITSLGNVGIGTFTPLSLLTVGEASSTTAAKGLSFGGDASANLYRSAASTIKTDGSLTVVGGASFGGSVGIGTTTVFSKTTISKTGVSLPTTADNTNNAHLTLAGSDSLVRLQFGTQNVAPFGGWIQSSYDNTAITE
jgi:hypothetical protein